MTMSHIKKIKNEVQMDLVRRRQADPDLKLGQLLQEVAQREGYPGWNEYKTYLKKLGQHEPASAASPKTGGQSQ